jgi:hypothetical protein
LIQNKVLGKITRVECGTPRGMSLQQHVPNEKVAELIGKPPAGFDWDMYSRPVGRFDYTAAHHDS